MIDFHGHQLPLYTTPMIHSGPPCNPLGSGRCFELALAQWYICTRPFNFGVEVGAVTPYYWGHTHVVIDIADTIAVANHIDIRNVRDFCGKHVLSISTLEHVEPGLDGATELRRILNESKSCLITVPVGANLVFDQAIRVLGLNQSARVYQRVTTEQWNLVCNTPYTGNYTGPHGVPLAYATTVAVFYKEEIP